jgi:hypothetical protein
MLLLCGLRQTFARSKYKHHVYCTDASRSPQEAYFLTSKTETNFDKLDDHGKVNILKVCVKVPRSIADHADLCGGELKLWGIVGVLGWVPGPTKTKNLQI